MDVESLRGELKNVLNDLKRELRNTGEITPIFLCIHKDGTRKNFKLPPALRDAMNSGKLKDIIFGAMRNYTDHNPDKVAAWIFGHDSWQGVLTQEGQKHIHEGVDCGVLEMEKKGWAV